MMARFERVLILPDRAAWERALSEATSATNGRARQRLLAWPLPGLASFLAEAGASPEGRRQWNAEGLPQTGVDRSVVAVAWWTDFVGRKHARFVGQRDRLDPPRVENLLCPTGDERPALALVYPAQVLLAHKGGERTLVAVCACGAVGRPEDVGWMGTCCGPCHDRRQEGQSPPRAWPDAPPASLVGTRASAGFGAAAVACSPDAQAVAVWTAAGKVRVWDVPGRRCLATLPPGSNRSGDLTCVTFDADGRLLTGDGHGLLGKWDPDTGVSELVDRGTGRVNAIHRSADGSLLAVARTGQQLAVLNAAGRVPGAEPPVGGFMPAAAFSPDGGTLAYAPWINGVWVCDLATGAHRSVTDRLERVVGTLYAEVRSLLFSPDGKFLAVLWRPDAYPADPFAGTVLVWDVQREQISFSLQEQAPHTLCAAFSPDGKLLITGDVDHRVHVWDIARGARLLALEWHHLEVCSVALSADGSLLASCDSAGTLQWWPWEAVQALAQGQREARAHHAGP
jgi:sugar lactone lactonase YvrE